MPDYLARLAERALGVPSGAKPAIAPAFGPGPALPADPLAGSAGGDLEDRAMVPARGAPVHPAPGRPAGPPARPPLARPGGPAAQPPPRPSTLAGPAGDRTVPGRWADARPAAADPTPGPAAAGPRPAPAREARPAPPPRPREQPPDRPAPPAVGRPPAAGRPPAPAAVRPRVAPARPAARPARSGVPAGGRPRAAAGPTIRVHIGRVEVRAVVPAAPAPPPRPARPPGPRLSLEDYLRSRDGDR
jgi:translation initiation factor IF-2